MSESRDYDPLEVVLEEVALEGLDGITLQALWLRLETSQNTNQKPLDKHWKCYFFNLLKGHPEISMYKLCEEREPLFIFDFKKYIDPYTYLYIEPSKEELPVDIYPYVPIHDESENITGSCSTYKTRQNITDDIKYMSYEEVIETYKNKLVFVASQKIRTKYLILTKAQYIPPDYELSLNGYCILERIARSRQYGCIDIVKEIVKLNPKDIFYLRKELLSRKWITKQSINKQKAKGIMRYNLYYLTRYHVEHKSKVNSFMQSILENLKAASSTNYILPIKTLNDAFESVSSLNVKRLLNFFHLNDKVKELDLPFTQVYPDLPEHQCFTSSKKEKKAPCIQLLDPNMNIEQELNKDFDDSPEDADSDEEGETEEVMEGEREEEEEQDILDTQSEQSCFSLLEALTNIDEVSDLSDSESLPSCPPPTANVAYSSDEEFVEQTMQVSFLRKKGILLEHELPVHVSLRKQLMKTAEQAGPEGYSALQVKKAMKLNKSDIRKLVKHNAIYLNTYLKDEGRQRTQYFRLKKYANAECELYTEKSSLKVPCDVPCKKIKLEHQETAEGDETGDKGETHDHLNETSGTNQGSHAEILKYLSSTETTLKEIHNPNTKNLSQVFSTDLQRARASDIISFLKEIQFTVGHSVVFNHVLEKDKARPTPGKIDRKTNLKILEKLVDQGFLKKMFVTFKITNMTQTEKSLQVYADYDFSFESETFTATLQTESMKFSDIRSINVPLKKSKGKSLARINKNVSENKTAVEVPARTVISQTEQENIMNREKTSEEQKVEVSSQMEIKNNENISYKLTIIQPTENEVNDVKDLYPSVLMRERADDCLKFIQQHRITSGFREVRSYVVECDKKRNYTATIDHRTVKRLLDTLTLNNFIKCFNVKFRNKEVGSEKDVQLYSMLDIDPDDTLCVNHVKKEQLAFWMETSLNATKRESPQCGEYNLVMLPKFGKMERMHMIAFHVAYSSANPLENQHLARKNLEHICHEKIPENHPPIYCDSELSDFTFLPSLSPPKSYPGGFISFQDLFMLLPIRTFLQCLRHARVGKEVDSYSEHPVKRFYPLKNTSNEAVSTLTRLAEGRKHVSSVYQIFANLASIGLVQLGKRFGMEKENFALYVNRKTSLKDTITCEPGYIELDADEEKPIISYNFQKLSDVRKYWLNSCKICTNTPLGLRAKAVVGQKVISYKKLSDKPILAQTCVHCDDVNLILSRDNGQLPGDGKGAAGFDSSAFAHMKKNWNITCKTLKAPTVVKLTRNVKKAPKLFRRDAKPPSEKKTKFIERVVKARNTATKRSKIVEESGMSLSSMRRIRNEVHWTENDADVLHMVYILYKLFKLKPCNSLTRDVLIKVLGKKFKTKEIITSKMLLNHYRRILKMSENKERLFLLEAEVNHREEARNFLAPHIKKHRDLSRQDHKSEAHQYIISHFLDIVKALFEMLVVNYKYQDEDEFPTDYEHFLSEYKTVECKETLHDIYPVLNTVTNIKLHVLLNLIHSSLASGSEIKKNNMNMYLTDAYQRYPEPLIHKAVKILKKFQIIASSRVFGSYLQRVNKANSTTLAMTRFKLSNKYINKISLTEMQCSSFHASYVWLKQISNCTQSSPHSCDHVNSGFLTLFTVLLSEDLVKLNIETPKTLLLLDPKMGNSRIVDRYHDLVNRYKFGTVNNKEDDEEDDDKQDSIPPMDMFNAARLAMYTLKDVLKKEKISAQHMQKIFTLDTCKILLGEVSSPVKYQLCNGESYLRELRNRIRVPALTQEQINSLVTSGFEKRVEEFIEGKLEVGATSEDIRLTFGATMKVKSTLDSLLDKQVVIQTGNVLVTYVHNKHCSSWLVKANPQLSTKRESIETVIVPWIHVDSSLNRQLLDYMLCVVMSYLMFNPGVSLLTLQEHFASVLQPTHIIELVDLLVRIKCVTIQVLTIVKATLFTKGSVKVSSGTLLEPANVLYIEPMPDASLRLGFFIGDKAYEKDFLDELFSKDDLEDVSQSLDE